jgi:hypothetical protein
MTSVITTCWPDALPRKPKRRKASAIFIAKNFVERADCALSGLQTRARREYENDSGIVAVIDPNEIQGLHKALLPKSVRPPL